MRGVRLGAFGTGVFVITSAARAEVVSLAEPCAAAPAGATACQRLSVTCGGLAPRVVEVAHYAAAGTPRGAVLFGSGTVGATFYNFTDRDTLRAAGLHVLERRWVDGWFEGATEGPQQAACGLAELIEHLRAELPASLALCATGNSGGSVELGYALTWHGASAWLDFALPTSGPFHRLDLACQGESNAAWTARCEDLKAGLCPGCASEGCQVGGPRAHIDTAFDHVPRCTAPGAGDLAALRARSPLFGPSVPLLAGFPVQVLVGEADPGPYLPVAAAFALGLSAAGADVSFGIVPGGEHGLDNTLEGREAITSALLSHCGAP